MARKPSKKKIPKLKMTLTGESRLFHKLGEIVAGSGAPKDLLKGMLEETAMALGVPVAAVELFNEASQAMQFRAVRGLELQHTDLELQMPVEFALSGTVVQKKAPLIENDPGRSSEFWLSQGMTSYLGFPMIVGERCLGTLSLAHPEKVEVDGAFIKSASFTARWMAQFIEGQMFRQSGEPAGVIFEKMRAEYEQELQRLTERLHQKEAEQKALTEKTRAASSEIRQIKQFYDQARRQLLKSSAEREELEQLRKEFEHIDRELRETQQALRSQSMQDELTGLPNEPLFRYLFTQALARCRRQKEMIGLMFIDLDRFNEMKKQNGERVADGILKQMADRLRRNVREGDTVARVGLDEFVWTISNLQDMEDLAIMAEKMLAISRRPVQVDGVDYRITASIGISTYPYDSGEVDLLMQQSITALIRAKELGRDTYQFYTEEVNSRLRERLALKKQLHEALSKHEFLLHYQPVLNMTTQQVEGLEALLRWKNPDGKLAYPEEFLKVSEDTGLIAPLDEWVLRTACQQIQKWADQDGGASLFLSVNISRKLFQQIDFPQKVSSILRETGFPAQRLELEVQEKTLMDDIDRSVAAVKGLRDIGVRVSIDDFGTGTLSLNQLKLLPLTTVKIDPAFTRNLPADSANASIVAGMISLAHTMGLRVIAEGLEQDAELKYLKSLKCDMFQGHLFRPPLAAESVPDILKKDPDAFDVEIPLDIDEELLFDDPMRTMTMPSMYVPQPSVQVQAVVAPALENVVRHAISKTYPVTCANCRNQFDAMAASWCSCLVTERTLECPHCTECLCKAPLEFKLDFWTEAPQGMWDRRLLEEGRYLNVNPNPVPSLARRPLVLILDDERPIMSMAAQLIDSLGYGVVTGSNGEEGLALAREYKPDLVLSDALMPRMDGREMCRKIKNDPQFSKTKVIIMTSLSTRPRDRSTAYREFRMDEYLQKPLAYRDLKRVLEKLLPPEH